VLCCVVLCCVVLCCVVAAGDLDVMTSAKNRVTLFYFLPFTHSVLFIVSLSTTFAVNTGLLWAIPAMLRDSIEDTPLTELHI
jgi:hypothetical protein